MKVNGFMRLDHDFVRSAKIKAISANGKALILAMADRYNGFNNGSILFGVREVAEWLHSSKSTALRTLAELKDAGLIEPVELGSFNLKAGSRKGAATTWRLNFIPSHGVRK